MRMSASTVSALTALVLGAAALLLAALSIPSALPQEAPPGPAAPTTVEVSLVITGLGAAGQPAKHHFYNPSMIVVRKGDTLRVRFMNLTFATHGIEFTGYGVRTQPLPGGPTGQETVTFVANKAGVFPFHCYVPYDPATGQCSPDHDTQVGYLVVLDQPR